MRKYLLLISICSVLGVGFFVYVHYSVNNELPGLRQHGEKFLLAFIASNVIGFLILQIDKLLDKLLHWRNNFFLRFLVGVVVNMSLAVALMVLSVQYLSKANAEELSKFGILCIISVFVYEIFYGWFFSYRYYAVTQVEQLRSERLQLELQFQSLKTQISPHYLFNCLNTVSSLLYKDSNMAETFIRRMADTFRYVLSNQKEKLVGLRDEIEFLKAYYYLMQVRYEDQLRLEINIPKNVLNSVIPPLTLQLLVENAIKHNRITREHPLFVYISAKDNTHIIVTSTKSAVAQPATSFKIGLENIKQRYRYFTSEAVVINDGNKFIVQLPVLSKRENGNVSPLTKLVAV